MLWPTCLFLLASWIAPARALTEAEVGIVDWHTSLVGVPLLDWASTAPSFHNTGENSVVVTATGSNVLAALHATNGSVAWRYAFPTPHDQIVSYSKHDGVVAALSGPGGATLRLFDALRGTLLLEQRLHEPSLGRLEEPGMGTASVVLPSGDVLVLTNSHEVKRVSRTSGETVWAWAAEDQTSLVVYNKLVPTEDAVYVVGLAKSIAGLTLHVTALASATGAELASQPLPGNLEGPDVLALSAAGAPPVLAWLDKSVPTSVVLTPALDKKPQKARGEYARLVDVGLGAQGWFVAVTAQDQARVLRQGDDGALKGVWEFEFPGPKATRSDLLFAGGVDPDGKPYLARVHFSKSMGNLAHVTVYSPTHGSGGGTPHGFAFPFDTSAYGHMSHVAISPVGGSAVRAKVLVTSSAGALQLWDSENALWTRDEALAYIAAAELVELPERAAAAGGAHDESFFARLQRHLIEAQNLPAYIRAFTTRFVTGSYETASSAAATSDGALVRDQFGFRKVLVAATPFGSVVGLDGATGKELWRRLLGDEAGGGQMYPLKIFVSKTAGEGGPEVVLVAQRRSEEGQLDTVMFHVNALTGEDFRPGVEQTKLLMGVPALSGGIVEAFQHTFDDGVRAVLLVTDQQQVVPYPQTPSAMAPFGRTADSLHFAVRTGRPGQRKLMGHRVSARSDGQGAFPAYPAWTLSLRNDEDIRAVLAVPRRPAASLGKVLGNRTTLYKYLNPRLTAVLTAGPGACGVRLVDGASGAVVYHAHLPVEKEGQRCDVKAALAENWLVYHFWDPREKSFRFVSVELYEGQGVDQKTKSSETTAHDASTRNVQAFEQAFIVAHDVAALAMTTTQFGITAMDLIVANKNGHIQTYPRRLLDPRRTRGKPSAEEVEEGLLPYDPLLPDDTRRVISHNYPVAEVKSLITSPTQLESTSLVCAIGLDLFCTRVAPSRTFDVLSENFNKVQLVLTCAALALAIFVTKPMVARKRLRERWFR